MQRQVRDGASFIKIYNALPREATRAVAEECRRLAVPFVGHVPDELTSIEAAALGERSIEHLDAVLLDCA